MTKKTPSELILPELDVTVVHLLDCFYDVKTAAGEKITYNELKSYQQLMCVHLSAWQVEVIMTIDSIFEGAVHG